MEEELQDALVLYRDNISAVRGSLQGDPQNAELLQLLGELQDALATTQEALGTLQSQAAAAATSPAAPQGPSSSPAAQPPIGPPQLPASASQAPQGGAFTARDGTAGSQPPQAAAPRFSGGGSQIHPRNKYATELPDFAALAEQYPSLQRYLQRRGPGRPTIDFRSQEACRELTKVLLKHDYGIEWWVPLGQLVPPLTNRANYIHWLEDLLALSSPQGEVVGLDVGCGANLIYPLLGAAINRWRFVGVDVTETALEWAAANRRSNPHLALLIELRRVGMQPDQHRMHTALWLEGGSSAAGPPPKKRARREQQGQAGWDGMQGGLPEAALHVQQEEPQEAQQAERGPQGEPAASSSDAAVSVGGKAAAVCADGQSPAANGTPPGSGIAAGGSVRDHSPVGAGILSGAVQAGERFAFCMCNPPFFESMAEAGRNPATAFAGTAEEMVYPGGEMAFVEAMVEDSVSLQGQIHWYTTMVGKKGTMKAVRTLLYRHGVRVLRTTEFVQGKTSRWAIAWSFTADPNVALKPLARPPPPAHPAI